jgi:hypothetical protein
VETVNTTISNEFKTLSTMITAQSSNLKLLIVILITLITVISFGFALYMYRAQSAYHSSQRNHTTQKIDRKIVKLQDDNEIIKQQCKQETDRYQKLLASAEERYKNCLNKPIVTSQPVTTVDCGELQTRNAALEEEMKKYVREFRLSSAANVGVWFQAGPSSNWHFPVQDVQGKFEYLSSQFVPDAYYSLIDDPSTSNNATALTAAVIELVFNHVRTRIESIIKQFEKYYDTVAVLTDSKLMNDEERRSLRSGIAIELAKRISIKDGGDYSRDKSPEYDTNSLITAVNRIIGHDSSGVVQVIKSDLSKFFEIEIMRLRCLPTIEKWTFPHPGAAYNSLEHQIGAMYQDVSSDTGTIKHVLFPGLCVTDSCLIKATVVINPMK